jgi:hypothetical protein
MHVHQDFFFLVLEPSLLERKELKRKSLGER